jgi:hypothetical protein
MPKRRGCEVNVTDIEHKPYIEYSLQNDKRFTGEKAKVSTFIEAKNDHQFFIQVTVDNPFKFEEDLAPLDQMTASILGEQSNQASTPMPRKEYNTRTKHFDDSRPAEEEIGGVLIEPAVNSKVPFDLMVSVFIDGRAKPECRQMIYLDHKHPRYNSRCVLKGRWVDAGEASSRDGKAGLLQWVFTDRGVDHIMEQMDVKKVLGKADTDVREAEFKDVCDDVGEGIFEDTEDKIMKVGEIEVRLRRVVVQESGAVEQKFRAYHYADYDEKPRDLDDSCTHTTSFLPKTAAGQGKIETFALRHVAWNHYKKGEEFLVRMGFKYTARHKLVNLQLSELDGTPTLKGRIVAPELDPSNKRGKKRASSIEGESVEQTWAENPSPKKASRCVSTVGDSTSIRDPKVESDVSEEDEDDTDGYNHSSLRAQKRHKMGPTQAKLENYKKVKVKDDGEQIF